MFALLNLLLQARIFTDQNFLVSHHISQIIYSSSIDIKDVINSALEYKKMLNNEELGGDISDDLLEELTSDNNRKFLYYAASSLRNIVKNVEGINLYPLNPEDITLQKGKDIVPENLWSNTNDWYS